MALTIAQVLDLLMALIIVMFIPIGLWRGALREWVALAGILLGAALAAEWAYPWGGDLANELLIDPKLARFAVGALLFLAVTLFIGYGAGMALPYRPDLSWPNRLLGALLGLGNGALILSSALRIMQHNLFDDQASSPLLGSALAYVLIEQIGWVLLALTVVFFLTVWIGAFRSWRGRAPLLEEYAPVFYEEVAEPWDEPDAARQAVPVGRPAPEPEAEDDHAWEEAAALRRDEFASQSTTVLRPPAPAVELREIVPVPAEPPAATPPAADDAATPIQGVPAPSNGRADEPTPPPSRRVVDIARPQTSRGEATTALALPAETALAISPTAGDEPTLADLRPGAAATIPASAPASPPPDDDPAPTRDDQEDTPTDPALRPAGATAAAATCSVCGSSLAPEARFCPACGHISRDAERRTIARRSTKYEVRSTN
ncbi:MAG TPA: CvpA family protein [Thermomicrobiales bacterium]|nr:CvpA family protein [Thermomicrobiales bacterium]